MLAISHGEKQPVCHREVKLIGVTKSCRHKKRPYTEK